LYISELCKTSVYVFASYVIAGHTYVVDFSLQPGSKVTVTLTYALRCRNLFEKISLFICFHRHTMSSF